MRGAERPAKVRWTRPFVPPLKPLAQDAARQVFIAIADGRHDSHEVDKVLALTDNMPLAISLLAHLVDSEDCSTILGRWQVEKTSLVSDGYDRRSNLDSSISLSLSSPRIKVLPHSVQLLSLLSILPDGLSDVELVQSKVPIKDILSCKVALIRTALAYSNEHRRVKALVPIREYMHKTQPPGDQIIRPLLKYFQDLLELYTENEGRSSQLVAQIASNYSNIRNVLQIGLQQEHPELKKSIYALCHLNSFSRVTGQGTIPLMDHIFDILPQLGDSRLELYFITELFSSWWYRPIPNPEALIDRIMGQIDRCHDTDLKCMSFY
jgi:hypothetical protein